MCGRERTQSCAKLGQFAKYITDFLHQQTNRSDGGCSGRVCPCSPLFYCFCPPPLFFLPRSLGLFWVSMLCRLATHGSCCRFVLDLLPCLLVLKACMGMILRSPTAWMLKMLLTLFPLRGWTVCLATCHVYVLVCVCACVCVLVCVCVGTSLYVIAFRSVSHGGGFFLCVCLKTLERTHARRF